jgi:hypothetical protein
MSEQPETTLVARPFIEYITYVYGWQCFRTNGNLYQSGFPDYRIVHHRYSPKWIECKLLTRLPSGKLSRACQFTDAQKKVFPIWLANNDPIWIIASDDLRRNKQKLEEQYRLLLKPHNCYTYLDPNTRKLFYG